MVGRVSTDMKDICSSSRVKKTSVRKASIKKPFFV